MYLEKLLFKFKGATNEEDLQILFYELAQGFLYGGYIQVRNDYRIYIRTVEFYFHSEEIDGIHDPIVYHRNIRDKEGNILETVPYFPIMSLHAHTSGFDITFESEKGKYRASALIRSYEVKNKADEYLTWNKEKCNFVNTKQYGYNKQSTYLYALLNGFPLGNDNGIMWVDSPRESKAVPGKPRQNVFQSKNEKEYKPIKGCRCKREWSFTREEQV